MAITITIKEYATVKTALNYCRKIEHIVKERWQGKVTEAINTVDNDCCQVNLIGEFGEDIFLADL